MFKTHKTDIFSGMPIKPVVCYRNSPTYKLEKWLHGILKKYFKVNSFLKNSLDLEIKEDDIILSLDISNLYTNFPTGDLIDIIKNNFEVNIPPIGTYYQLIKKLSNNDVIQNF